jgi:hypothetical protein
VREFLSCLHTAFRRMFLIEPWPEPERDATTPQVIADWIAAHKHPAECAGGCRCKGGAP